MDIQTLLNAAFAICGALALFLLRTVYGRIETLDAETRQFPKTYVHKDDHNGDMTYIRDRLDRILEKVESKADRTSR